MPDSHSPGDTPAPEARPSLKLRLEARLGLLDPIVIVVFRSYGTPDAIHLRGRVIERKGIQGSTEETSTWRNILNTLQRLDSDEIPGARIRAHLQGQQWETTSDQEGYFVFALDCPEPLAPGWHDVELELVETVGEPERRRVHAPVLVPAPDAEFAVVSDLDDTVIRTHANDALRELAIVFGKSAQSRSPMPGVPALYRALARGPDDRGSNPLFYVSRSGWNLYDLMEEFLDLNRIPSGPMFLNDLHIIEDRSTALGSARHKFDSIDQLLRTYPDLPFILIGDSGQHDPELYHEIATTHPGRIAAVYIRDVSPPERDREVQRIAESLEQLGIPMIRTADSVRIAEHAADHGYLSSDGVAEVRREVERETLEEGKR